MLSAPWKPCQASERSWAVLCGQDPEVTPRGAQWVRWSWRKVDGSFRLRFLLMD